MIAGASCLAGTPNLSVNTDRRVRGLRPRTAAGYLGSLGV